ncbi:MAG: coproporphyrinogen III oxidase family protein [Rickettsiales bacterium]|nr:coproporphyrinogen III oxidase family protein [Rickettsiales bacterium]
MNFYIHVPFCVKKCNYCAFYSVCDAPDWENYTRGVCEQLDYFKGLGTRDQGPDTIFFGGGTPSLMPVKYAAQIIEKIGAKNPAEFTIEANPKTLNASKLKDWKDLGLTRLSVGMQSFDDEELQFLGRIHSAADACALIDAGLDSGLRVSADFIYGLPGQSAAAAVRLCENINVLGIEHASLYELTIEKGTPFAGMKPPTESIGAEMYRTIQSALRLPRYEVSNYGEPCLHNSAIWAGEQYIGVGESAAGRVRDSDGWLETKIVGGCVVANRLTNAERATEIIMTGLRTMRGVALCAVFPSFGGVPPEGRLGGASSGSCAIPLHINWPFINSHPEYFIAAADSLRMTESGLLLLDGLMGDVIL